MILALVFVAGCATALPKNTMSQGGKTMQRGTGTVTVTRMLDGRQNVDVQLVGQPLF